MIVSVLTEEIFSFPLFLSFLGDDFYSISYFFAYSLNEPLDLTALSDYSYFSCSSLIYFYFLLFLLIF